MSRSELERVTELLEFLIPSFAPQIAEKGTPAYGHVGALLADVSLQAGLNYERVVMPRIQDILTNYPDFKRTSDISKLFSVVSAEDLLRWKGAEKADRFRTLVSTLLDAGVETVAELKEWTSSEHACQRLFAIRGIGNKSLDYLRLLCGHSTFPIDRHLYRFLAIAGVDRRECRYERAQELFIGACTQLCVEPVFVEKGLWNLMRACV
jgi:hypothetical protein